MGCAYIIAMVLVALATNVSPKPVMVSFGTNRGPIVPRPPTTTEFPQPRIAPAPVSERSDDIPNPSVYRPLVPQQYRNRVLSFRPNPNLILGTAQDQKYLGTSDKFTLLKREQARAIGLDYKGPQFFEVQEYEIEKERQRPTPKQLFQPILQPFQTRRSDQQWSQSRQVPEIGIVYSSGVRYYVPQISYDDSDSYQNSVYDGNDVKYLYSNTQQYKNY